MAIVKSAKPENIGQLVALADRIFRKPGQTSMGTAYAQLFANENADRLLMVEEDGQPVSLVGLLPARLSVAGCTIPVVSMGSVCTDMAYRGRNYADLLVKRSIARCAEEGAQLLLISGTRGLYLRNDGMEVGGLKRFAIRSAGELPSSAETEAYAMRPYDGAGDRAAMLRLMESDGAYYMRTDAELEQLIRSAAFLSNYPAEQHIWLSFTADGEAAAYAVFGSVKKKDGESVVEIVEYAGGDEAVIGLLGHIAGMFGFQPLSFPVMAARASLAEALVTAGCSFTEETIPGTIRMIDFQGLWKTLRPYMEQQLGEAALSELSLTEVGGGCRIAYKGETLTVGNRGATALLFNGPSIVGQGELKQVLSRMFPLPFPFTESLNFV
ncbi:GNAT family N-acetyltransferase [Paenibacillus piri]|nr:GNAT family N-acetyltransferase [Paenibacillus piri]